MKRKILLMIAVMLCMLTVSAADKTVELSSGTTSGNATWTKDESGNYTFTWTSSSDYVDFTLGDVSAYYDLEIKLTSASNFSDSPGLTILDGTKKLKTFNWSSSSAGTKYFYWQYYGSNNNMQLSNSALSSSGIVARLHAGNSGGSMTISSITLKAASMTCLPGILIDNLTYYKGETEFTPANLSNTVITPSSATIYGYYQGSESYYADIKDYATLNVEISEITSGHSKASVRCNIYTSEDGATYTAESPSSSVTSAGTISFDLSSYNKDYPVKLNFIKGGANSNATTDCYFTVGNIYLTKANDPVKYYIIGQRILPSNAGLTTAKADASCTAVDVSGVTSLSNPSATSMLDLDPTDFTNKNCLFIAPSAATSLTQNNVIFGTTCTNLSLVDGSAFSAPSAFTATNATYSMDSRDMNTTTGTRYGTIILPFAVSNTNYKFFTIASASSSTIVLSEAQTVEANKPYIFRLNANAGGSATVSAITASSAAIAATPTSLTQDAVNGLTLTGSYTTQTLDGTAATYYFIGASDAFYKSAGSIKVNPFRAYFAATNALSAKTFNLSENDSEVTLISDALAETPLVVTTGIGTITLQANSQVPVIVCTVNGMVLHNVQLNAGDETTVPVPSGIYLVNGTKVAVK